MSKERHYQHFTAACVTQSAAVGVGFTQSELTGVPGSTVELVVAITNGSLGPNETASVQCVSLNGTATGVSA